MGLPALGSAMARQVATHPQGVEDRHVRADIDLALDALRAAANRIRKHMADDTGDRFSHGYTPAVIAFARLLRDVPILRTTLTELNAAGAADSARIEQHRRD